MKNEGLVTLTIYVRFFFLPFVTSPKQKRMPEKFGSAGRPCRSLSGFDSLRLRRWWRREGLENLVAFMKMGGLNLEVICIYVYIYI